MRKENVVDIAKSATLRFSNANVQFADEVQDSYREGKLNIASVAFSINNALKNGVDIVDAFACLDKQLENVRVISLSEFCNIVYSVLSFMEEESNNQGTVKLITDKSLENQYNEGTNNQGTVKLIVDSAPKDQPKKDETNKAETSKKKDEPLKKQQSKQEPSKEKEAVVEQPVSNPSIDQVINTVHQNSSANKDLGGLGFNINNFIVREDNNPPQQSAHVNPCCGHHHHEHANSCQQQPVPQQYQQQVMYDAFGNPYYPAPIKQFAPQQYGNIGKLNYSNYNPTNAKRKDPMPGATLDKRVNKLNKHYKFIKGRHNGTTREQVDCLLWLLTNGAVSKALKEWDAKCTKKNIFMTEIEIPEDQKEEFDFCFRIDSNIEGKYIRVLYNSKDEYLKEVDSFVNLTLVTLEDD
jgi:hypothetical protein